MSETPLVDGLIDKIMAENPGVSARAQAKYYEEVHQHLAPLARELELENMRLRAVVEAAKKIDGAMLPHRRALIGTDASDEWCWAWDQLADALAAL